MTNVSLLPLSTPRLLYSSKSQMVVNWGWILGKNFVAVPQRLWNREHTTYSGAVWRWWWWWIGWCCRWRSWWYTKTNVIAKSAWWIRLKTLIGLLSCCSSSWRQLTASKHLLNYLHVNIGSCCCTNMASLWACFHGSVCRRFHWRQHGSNSYPFDTCLLGVPSDPWALTIMVT